MGRMDLKRLSTGRAVRCGGLREIYSASLFRYASSVSTLWLDGHAQNAFGPASFAPCTDRSTALGACIVNLRGKEESDWSIKVIQATKIGPSIWPILFSGILGAAIRAFADRRAEHGVTLMVRPSMSFSGVANSTVRLEETGEAHGLTHCKYPHSDDPLGKTDRTERRWQAL